MTNGDMAQNLPPYIPRDDVWRLRTGLGGQPDTDSPGLELLEAAISSLLSRRKIDKELAEALWDNYSPAFAKLNQQELVYLAQFLYDEDPELNLRRRAQMLDRFTAAEQEDIFDFLLFDAREQGDLSDWAKAAREYTQNLADEAAEAARLEKETKLTEQGDRVKAIDGYQNLIAQLPATLRAEVEQWLFLPSMAALHDDYLKGDDDTYPSILRSLYETALAKAQQEGDIVAKLRSEIENPNFPFTEPRGTIPGLGLPSSGIPAWDQVIAQSTQPPSLIEASESFLGETGLGRGTKLRSFIESEIPDIAQSTEPARQEWREQWDKFNIPQEQTFEEARDFQNILADKWRDIAQKAPVGAGVDFFGEGGLKNTALAAQAKAIAERDALKPKTFATFAEREAHRANRLKQHLEKDPFKAALKTTDFRSQFFRQPGTGLVSRLTPSVKF